MHLCECVCQKSFTKFSLVWYKVRSMEYPLDKQAITNIMKRHIKPIEKQKQIKFIIYNTKFKTSNLIVKNNTNSAKIHPNQINVVYKFICLFQGCLPKNKNNPYFGCTTTLFHHLTYHLCENSAIKQHLIIKPNNSTNQLTYSDVRKSHTDNVIIIYKNNNKK